MKATRFDTGVGQDESRRVALLVALALASIMLWQTELGSLLLYPFTMLATWFHEMGHGLAALLTGRGLERLMIFADGSGFAQSLRPTDGYRIVDAVIAASGPLGPAIAGSFLIAASHNPRVTRLALAGLSLALIVSTAIWVRSLAGWLVLPALGGVIATIALRASVKWQRFAIQFVGVQAGISAWRQFDYLFSPGGTVGGEQIRSDTGAIADVLLLPYWFWGATISGTIVASLWWSFRLALRR